MLSYLKEAILPNPKKKKIVKEKKPKSEIEDENLNPTNEDSMKKVKKKKSTSKCYY